MTIDEAISHALEVAEIQEAEVLKYNYCRGIPDVEKVVSGCKECAADHRQLAEWLTELKEAKRLLKAAVEDIESTDNCCLCKYHHNPDYICQTVEDCFTWRYADEALKLIES